MLRNHRVIDTHCHIYPAKIAAKAVKTTGDFYNCPSKLDGSAETLMREGHAAGVDYFLVSSVATTTHQVHSINHYIAGEAAASGGSILGLGALHPESPDQEADVEELLSLGLRGVKLHPDIQGFELDDPRCMRIFRLLEGRVPVLLHTGDYRYDYSNPNRLLHVLDAFPELTVIGAHFGTYTIWQDAPELFGIPNLWVDCSSSLDFLSPERALELIDGFGADRVLFGTDYPMWTPAEEIQAIEALGLSEEELELILHKNAETVFSLRF